MTNRAVRDRGALDGLAFDERGLIPVVAQDAATGAVLMVAWANREAVERSLETRDMHFWSRSREELWRKGDTSGNVLRLVSLHADCDGDTLLARVDPTGPACHTGDPSCFGDGTMPTGLSISSQPAAASAAPAADPAAPPAPAADEHPAARTASPASGEDVLSALAAVLDERARTRPEGSYTTRLLEDENLRLKKLGEETVELVIALAKEQAERIPEEAADLLYHVMVALRAADVPWERVLRVLEERRG